MNIGLHKTKSYRQISSLVFIGLVETYRGALFIKSANNWYHGITKCCIILTVKLLFCQNPVIPISVKISFTYFDFPFGVCNLKKQ